MDIYRFFHPHHNPRLHSTPLRQQELGELEQAASELLKALERAQKRTVRKAPGAILPQHFNDIQKAMRFVLSSLETLCDAHPGDSPETLYDLIQERSELTGWETWTSLLHEQITARQIEELQMEASPLNPSGNPVAPSNSESPQPASSFSARSSINLETDEAEPDLLVANQR